MNREDELTDILRKVEWGQMDSTVAFDRILRLFNVVGQSEQLKAFLIWAENEGYNITPFKDEIICDYIKSL